MDMSEDVRAAIVAVRDYLRSEIGLEERRLDPAFVPESLHDIVPFAAQFGIGDDGARGHVLALMPGRFVDELQTLVKGRRAAVDGWLADPSPWEDEKDAFCALLQGLDTARRGHASIVSKPGDVGALKDAATRIAGTGKAGDKK